MRSNFYSATEGYCLRSNSCFNPELWYNVLRFVNICKLMSNIFSSVLPIFLVTLLGSIIKRNWITSEEFWRGLEQLAYFILFPVVLFNYISSADLSSKAWIQLIIGLIVATSIVALSLIWYRKKTNGDVIQFTSMFQGSIRYNSYVFFALGGALFGDEGLAIVSVISFYMIIFTNILSVLVFAKYIPRNTSEGFFILLRLVRTNPLIVASITGFVFNYCNIELYIGIKKTLHSLSDAALAIGMLNVGAGLKLIIASQQLPKIMTASLIKLIALPIVTFAVLSILSIGGMEKSVGILYSCLPCATSSYILSRQLGGDPESMASIVMTTVIFSVVTIPLLMYVLG